jgi:hypothetical protein
MVIIAIIIFKVDSCGNTFLSRPSNLKKIKKFMVVKKYFNAFFLIIEKKLLPLFFKNLHF